LNVDQSKYRTYDYITGRWWQIDPLADEGDLVSLTPYNYSYNNPILYSDPEGDCPMCVGALVGALVDTGLQLAEIALDDNKTLSDFSFTSVAVSAATGAVGVGILTKVDKALKVANLAGKAATAIKVASGAATDAATSTASQLATKGEVNAKDVLIDVVAGGAAGKIAGDLAEKAAKNTPAAKVLNRQADRAQRVAGANGRPTRQAAAQTTKQKAENYAVSRGAAAGTAASGTISGAVKKAMTEDEKKKTN
jgi:hypothetical protein